MSEQNILIELSRLQRLRSNKKICNIVIQECKVKLPMCKMTYPEGVITNIQGFPDYSKSIIQARQTINNINKIILQYNRNNINQEVNKNNGNRNKS